MQVDKELFDLIKLSTYYSQITEGAFDITYASVGYLYDYPDHIHPTEAQIKAALPAVNWRNMLLDEAAPHGALRARRACASTWAASARATRSTAASTSSRRAASSTRVVTAGGDTRIIGDHMGRPWLVAIRHPDDPSKVVTRIPLVRQRDVDFGGLRALLR